MHLQVVCQDAAGHFARGTRVRSRVQFSELGTEWYKPGDLGVIAEVANPTKWTVKFGDRHYNLTGKQCRKVGTGNLAPGDQIEATAPVSEGWGTLHYQKGTVVRGHPDTHTLCWLSWSRV